VPGVSAAVHDATTFAESIAGAVARHPTADPWRPGAAADDRNAALDAVLAELGWDDALGADPALLGFVGPAAAALGAGLAPLAPLDRLLGGGALATGGLARYAEGAAVLVRPRAGRLEIGTAFGGLRARPYGDALGVADADGVRADGVLAPAESSTRMAAWMTASAGYLAGMTAAAVRFAVDHAKARRAFGAPLAALETVQQMLADAATLSRGLDLLARAPAPAVSAAALAHAGEAAVEATAICQQVSGAAAFTLELDLQRGYRRARAARAWADAAVEAWEAAP
jgi:acyl-CoA dehydrogenase